MTYGNTSTNAATGNGDMSTSSTPSSMTQTTTQKPFATKTVELPSDATAEMAAVMRLAARYASVFGERAFSTAAIETFVMGKEYATQRKTRTDEEDVLQFLEPRNRFHKAFRQLVEQYNMVRRGEAMPMFADGNVRGDRHDDGVHLVVRQAKREAIGRRARRAQRGAAAYEARRRREIFASTDWHDFAVVAVVGMEGAEDDSGGAAATIAPRSVAEARSGALRALLA